MYMMEKPWVDFDALRKETDLVIIPTGAVEVYGQHLPVGTDTVHVSITIKPQTGTKAFEAGLVMTGRQPGLDYGLSTGQVLVTLGGPLADLDRIDASAFTVNLNVGGLTPGVHQLQPTPNLQAGLRLLTVEPGSVTVTVSPISSPAPSPSGP